MEKELAVQNAEEAHTLIEAKAKKTAIPEVRQIAKMEIGQVVRQGDIYLHCVAQDHKRGDKTKNRQLALGNSIGSRHVAEAPAEIFAGIYTPPWCDGRTFLGPCIVSGAPFTVTHPEHAHIALPAGVYQVTHQLDVRTNQRVID